MKIDIKNISLWDIFIVLNLISFSGAIVYKLYKLNLVGILVSLTLSFLGFVFFLKLKEERKTSTKKIRDIFKNIKIKKKKLFSPLHLLYITLFSVAYYILFKSASSDSIISPWQVVPTYFFAIYGLATLTLIFLLKKSQTNLGLLLISAHYFLSFSVALAIYKIGYGFDPFVHEATLNIIKEKGFVDPKPYYYLGQYSLIIILNKILFLPISFLNAFLVPVLASIFVPRAIFEYLKKTFDNQNTALLTTLSFLIIPFSFFIITTPQNLAYLLIIIIIIKSLKVDSYYDLFSLYLLALSALVTQAVAGIPALLFVVIINIFHSNIKFKKSITFLVLLIMTFSLPLSFYLFQKNTGTDLVISSNITENIISPIRNTANFSVSPFVPKSENIFLNFIYLYAFNLKFVFLLLFLTGAFLYYSNKKECKIFIHFFFAFASLFLAYLLSSFFDYSFLVDYERSDYPKRILLVSSFFFLPFLFLAFYYFFHKLAETKKSIYIPVFIFISVLISTSLYLSYPRYDAYYNSRGYSVGQYDIEATKWIEDNNKKQYFVLANQQVSAAALKNFGFNKYFSHNIFYYPIPTSSPLYNHYLEMVYDRPSKDNIKKAMDLININEAYFVLNKYWWAFPKILEEAKLEADSYTSFGEGEVYVFKYLR